MCFPIDRQTGRGDSFSRFSPALKPRLKFRGADVCGKESAKNWDPGNDTCRSRHRGRLTRSGSLGLSTRCHAGLLQARPETLLHRLGCFHRMPQRRHAGAFVWIAIPCPQKGIPSVMPEWSYTERVSDLGNRWAIGVQ
jgi:hypothetical protein